MCEKPYNETHTSITLFTTFYREQYTAIGEKKYFYFTRHVSQTCQYNVWLWYPVYVVFNERWWPSFGMFEAAEAVWNFSNNVWQRLTATGGLHASPSVCILFMQPVPFSWSWQTSCAICMPLPQSTFCFCSLMPSALVGILLLPSASVIVHSKLICQWQYWNAFLRA